MTFQVAHQVQRLGGRALPLMRAAVRFVMSLMVLQLLLGRRTTGDWHTALAAGLPSLDCGATDRNDSLPLFRRARGGATAVTTPSNMPKAIFWTVPVIALLAVAAAVVINWAESSRAQVPVLGQVPRFTLTERSGKTITLDDLKEHLTVS